MQQKTDLEEYKLLGVKVRLFNLDSLLGFMEEIIDKNDNCFITHHNLHSIYLINKTKDKRFAALQNMVVNHIDGMPIVYMGKMFGYPFKKDHRITWVDLIYPLINCSANKNWKIFYLGSDEQTALSAVQVFKTKHPGLNIVYKNGFFNTDVNSCENESTIKHISEFNPNVLIVGMGMPRQELWIYENRNKIKANIIMTAGAAMEYVAGTVKTPPRWMGRASLEWVYRLLENPKRFWFRYMIEPWFVFWLFIKDLGKKYILKKTL